MQCMYPLVFLLLHIYPTKNQTLKVPAYASSYVSDMYRGGTNALLILGVHLKNR